MFTGIIEETGTIQSVMRGAKSSRLTVKAGRVLSDAKTGDSICTGGVCLTVTETGAGYFSADVMPETMKRTTLGLLKPGSKVNLERALRPGDRMGGHLVNGHVDGTGGITGRLADDNAIWFTISADTPLLRYIVEKGSVAINGISLTVAGVDSRSFRVSVIPHTLIMTTLEEKRQGDTVNIECDIIAKYTEKLCRPGSGGGSSDRSFLAGSGF
ncbi:MAG TPA: riboflavin synthase [Bacteroidales bacterium]|nr:riboflavin synthase [Bacteroidales bacterium]